MTAEEKDIQLKKNKNIKENFKTKEKQQKKFISIIIIIITILFIGINILISITTPQQNNRDTSKDQIQITNDFIRIRQYPNISDTVLGQVKEGEIYTILDKEKEYGSYWYKIKTNTGITGYVYSGNDNEYIKLLKKSNKS